MTDAHSPPRSALECMPEMAARLQGRPAAVFLDYDGTLTPIVARPELAVLAPEMRAAVRRLAQSVPVAVVSGRDLADVRSRVALGELYYAGSHGFDIAGPGGEQFQHPSAVGALAALDAAELELRAALAPIEGALLERKRFSLAAHYRLVRTGEAGAVEQAVREALGRHAGLREGRGKMVIELLPAFAWDKGAAVLWLLRAIAGALAEPLPVYVGDDLTDEDAFRAVAGKGIGIVVLQEPRATLASYRLRDVAEVQSLLGALAGVLEGGR